MGVKGGLNHNKDRIFPKLQEGIFDNYHLPKQYFQYMNTEKNLLVLIII